MRASYPSIGAACARSSDLPCGTPSIISTSTTSPSSLLASQCAAVAPTLPAPTTVILFRLPIALRVLSKCRSAVGDQLAFSAQVVESGLIVGARPVLL